MKTISYKLKSRPETTVHVGEEYAKEASRLIEAILELKDATKLLQMDREYPILKDLSIFARAQMLVNNNYEKHHALELQDELYFKICAKYYDNIRNPEERKEMKNKIKEGVNF